MKHDIQKTVLTAMVFLSVVFPFSCPSFGDQSSEPGAAAVSDEKKDDPQALEGTQNRPPKVLRRYEQYYYQSPNEMMREQIKELSAKENNPLRVAVKELGPEISDQKDRAFGLVEKAFFLLKDFLWDKVFKARIQPLIPHTIGLQGWIIVILVYALTCFPLMLIAERLGLKTYSWMAFVPVLQVFLFLRMADKPLVGVILLIIPLVNLIYFVIMWNNICEFLQKHTFLAKLMLVPGLNICIMWYLALL